MYSTLKLVAVGAAVLVAACGRGGEMSEDLKKDLAMVTAGGDLELASRSTDQATVVGMAERTSPPRQAVAPSQRAKRPRRAPEPPQVLVENQEEMAPEPEPEQVAQNQPDPEPSPVEEAPAEEVISVRPQPIEASNPAGGRIGTGNRGIDLGTIIGIFGAAVIRGGAVGEDRCIPPTTRRNPMAINERFPIQGTYPGRVTGRTRPVATGGRQIIQQSAPGRPRDVSIRTEAPRPQPSGSPSGAVGGQRERAAMGDIQ